MKFTPPFPSGGRGSLRKILEDIDAEEHELKENPLYKEGYDDGYEQGKREAERRAQHVISALIRIYDES